MDEAWAFEHSVECPVTREFAWRFWTDVSNWRLDSDIESVELNGPFAGGSQGTTTTRTSGKIEWRLIDVHPVEKAAVVEIPLPGAICRFRWTFEDLGDRTRITQRVSIAGENAFSVINSMASSLESSIPAGMRRLSESMAEAEAAC
jgi:polyketide cyclase/dehydrase/lipid transport protein